MRLKDKIALVTGASGGLGGGICEAFARDGADCVIVYHSDKTTASETAAVVEGLGRKAVLCQTDTRDEEQVKAMVRTALDAFGRLDILVANAGKGIGAPLMETTLDDFESLIRTNLIGTYLTVRHGAQPMVDARRGKIITTP